MKYPCRQCGCNKFDKGRSFDGRRAYRCKQCRNIHTCGLQGRKQRFSKQRLGYQFADSKGSYHVG